MPWQELKDNHIDLMESFKNITGRLNQGFYWIAGIALVVMLLLTVSDVIAVKVFRSPIPGALEYIRFISVVVIAFALGHTQQLKGHIQVEFFVSRMPARLRAAAGIFVSALGISLFALLAWRSYEFARILQLSGEVSMTQNIPFYPFVYGIAICCIPVCFQLIIELVSHVTRLVKR